MKLTRLFKEFFQSEQAGGILLIFCTLGSLFLSNSFLRGPYLAIWQFQITGHPIGFWINDGLMAIFFLLIGLELEREIRLGELSKLKVALLPIAAAVGGMVVPASLYFAFNVGKPTQSGAGIPMATDIAFAIAVLSLVGSRVPSSLKVLLTALAVIDDLGAIIVIAIFYAGPLSWTSLGMAAFMMVILMILNRMNVYSLLPYIIVGAVMWYFMLKSGVHPTITGVLLAVAIPFRDGGEKSPSSILQHVLHKPVAFLILPLFALANTCIAMESHWFTNLGQPAGMGIMSGLIFGKPLGVFVFSIGAVLLGICSLPTELKWKHVLGIGFLGGIGFTMSIFITLLAFDHPDEINQSKMAVLLASLISAIAGFSWLKMTLPHRLPDQPDDWLQG